MTWPNPFVVAVVDDDSRTLNRWWTLKRRLRRSPVLVWQWAWKQSDWSKVDCLVSDIGMPQMNGFDLDAGAVRPDLPVILVGALGFGAVRSLIGASAILFIRRSATTGRCSTLERTPRSGT